jgi:hypothetical protein
MHIIRESNENEMVLAFLKAETDTPAWNKYVMPILSELRVTRTLIDNADLQNESENQARVHCLAYRGFKKNLYLFERFPDDIRWNRIFLSINELSGAKYINQQDPWVRFSSNTRLVSNGAGNSDPSYQVNAQISIIEKRVRDGVVFPDLILVGESEQSDLILLEGNKRATAYVRAKDYLKEGKEVIAGFSEKLSSWKWY